MKLFYSIFLIFLFSSAPNYEYQKKIKRVEYKVTWSKKNAPKVFSINQNIVHSPSMWADNETFKVSVYNGEDLSITVIPKSKKHAPLIFKLQSNNKVIDLTKVKFKPIEKNVTWLWGVTQKSHCRNMYVNYNIRSLYKTSLHFDIYGLFTWKISKDENQQNVFNFTVSDRLNDMAKSITSEVFTDPSKQEKYRCQLHYGAPCTYLKKIGIKEWSTINEVKFKKTLKLLTPNCPV
jgi:hypothetical protein